jgi:hypothetical protein
MRGLLVYFILTLALGAVAAVEIHVERAISHESACRATSAGPFEADLAVDNATLFQQVYAWMHQKDVRDWEYSSQASVNGTEPGVCALVSYKTYVASPSFFARMLQNFHMSVQFPVSVHKQVCLYGHTVLETATILAPLVHEMTLTARYDVEPDRITTVLDAHYALPWYLDFLIADISEHISDNFREKVDAVVQSLCSPTPAGYMRLPVPPHSYLRRIRERYGSPDKIQL